MHRHLRLVVTDDLILPGPAAARAEQLWRAAWLCVAGRIEPEGPPLLPDAFDDDDALFGAWCGLLRQRLGDRATPPVKALVSSACWFSLGLPSPSSLVALLGGHVAAWRANGCADDVIVRRLAVMLQPESA